MALALSGSRPVGRASTRLTLPRADLGDEGLALARRPLAVRVGADAERPVLDGDLDVLGTDAGQGRLDDELIGAVGHIERKAEAFGMHVPGARTHEAVFKEPIHRLAKRDELAEW